MKKFSVYALLFILSLTAISCTTHIINPRAIVIGRTDCVPCLEMRDLVDEINSESGNNTAIFVNIEVDDSVIKEFNISTLPTTIFFDEDDKEYYRQIRTMSKEEFISHMSEGDEYE